MNYKNALFLSFSFLFFFLLILTILISPKTSFASTIVDQDITTNTTWTAIGSPYLISADITVDDFVTLTIEPGTIVKFDYGYNIFVDGAVDAVGLSGNPITITSIADDTIGGDSNNDGNLTEPSSGDYGGFVFSFFSTGDFDYTNFKYGFTSIAGSPDDLTLNNSNFTNNYLPLLIDYATNFLHENNSYTNNDLNGVGLSGVSFMQDVYLTGGDGTYLIFDDLTIDNGYTLVLNAGTVLKTGDDYSNISFDIYGQMVSLGTQSNIVCITSISDDSCGGDTQNDGVSLDPSYGGFYDIYFNSINQTNSIINYTDIKYIKGSGGIYVDGAQLSIDNSNFIGKYSTIYFYQSLGNVITDSHFEDLWNTALDVSFDSTASITNTTIDMNGNNETAIDVYQNSYLEIYNSSISNAQNGITVNNNSDMLIEDIVVESITNTGVYLYNNSNTNVPMVSIKNSEIKNCGTGLYISDFIDVTFEFNKVNGNTFGVYNASINDLVMINNWWGSDTGPTHISNPSGTGDVVSDHIIFDPWTILYPTPTQYYAKITNAPGDIGNMRETASLNGVLIKTLPNDWVVHVVDTYENSPQIADGYMWYKIVDPTDASEGYMIASPDTSTIPIFLPYIDTEQTNFQTISETQLTTKVLRKGKMLEALNYYLSNTNITKSLYSSNDHNSPENLKISELLSVPVPFYKKIIMAMAAVEDPSFDNEIVSPDYGHGNFQLTFGSHYYEQPGKDITKNKMDNRGFISEIKLNKCRSTYKLPNGKISGTDEYKKCYENTGSYNGLKKPYDFYEHINTNVKFKEYTNTSQSIHANVKDGLGIIKQKYNAALNINCPANLIYEGITFTCNDFIRIFTVWGYNGFGYNQTTHEYTSNYLSKVSTALSNFTTYYPNQTFNDTDNLIQKMSIANNHKEEIRPHNPYRMAITDKNGNSNIIENGTAKISIPNSYFDENSGALVILFPEKDYTYEFVGNGKTKTNGFDIIINDSGIEKRIGVNNFPIKNQEVQRFRLDEDSNIKLDVKMEGENIFNESKIDVSYIINDNQINYEEN